MNLIKILNKIPKIKPCLDKSKKYDKNALIYYTQTLIKQAHNKAQKT